MGRLIFMLLVLAMLTFICHTVSRILKKGREMTNHEKRKFFDDDIEAVAKKIKEYDVH